VRVRDLLSSRLKDMRPAEAEVTRRLLRHPGLVAEGSLREVAARLETSDATVMRACRAAGFDGFQDLKYHVLRELTAGQVPAGSAAPGLYDADLAASLDAAGRTLEAATALLRGARRVALAGLGASRGVALVALDILFTLGRQALLIEDEQMAAYVFTPPAPELVLLAISHSGETQFPVQVVREARAVGVKSIALTNEPASELARLADVVLSTQAVESARGRYAIAPRICQLAVLDRLFTALAGKTP
jgi:DNA-binding MurR/RpiR family transcriptional regulator